MKPKLSFSTVRVIAAIVMGDPPVGCEKPLSPYRTHSRLDEFFTDDLGLQLARPPAGSRVDKANGWVKQYNGTSDIVRIIEASLRPVDFVGTEFNADVAAKKLDEHLAPDGWRVVKAGKGYRVQPSTGVAVAPPASPKDVLSLGYIQEMVDKCDGRLANGDLEGAVAVSRTLLEAVLCELECQVTGTRGEYGGNLSAQFKAVGKLLRIDDSRSDLDDNFRQVVRGLVQVAHGLAPIRNKMGDAHARQRRPAPHHARLVVNAAKTVSAFLLESFEYQREHGLIALPAEEEPKKGTK